MVRSPLVEPEPRDPRDLVVDRVDEAGVPLGGRRIAVYIEDREAIGAALSLQRSDWDRLQSVWGDQLWVNLHKMASERKRYTLRMLGGTCGKALQIAPV